MIVSGKKEDPFMRIRTRANVTGDAAGFSLVELLVTVVIIAVLAAIAIPLYTSQRTKSRAAETFSDARSLVMNAESARSGNPAGTALTAQFYTDVYANYRATPNTSTAIYRNCAYSGDSSMVVANGEYVVKVYYDISSYSEAIKNFAIYDSLTGAWRRGTVTGGSSVPYDTAITAGSNACTATGTGVNF